MRIIMLGTGPFAVPTLRALAASDVHDIALVVTRPPRGRAKPGDNPIRGAAEELDLECWAPKTVNSKESQARLTKLEAELLIVCDYGEILKPATLETTKLGGVNLHGSLLPKYRGAAPVQWAILNGDYETGNTVIEMTPGLDAGPCLAQERTSIDPDETAAELETRLAETGAATVLKVIDELASETAKPIEQDNTQKSKAPRLSKQDGTIDWSKSSLEIKNQVRALIPWPRAFTFWHRPDGEPLRLNIDQVQVNERASDAPPGSIMQADKQVLVQTGDGALELLVVQPAGKRSMKATEFLRGNRLQPGDRLGPA